MKNWRYSPINLLSTNEQKKHRNIFIMDSDIKYSVLQSNESQLVNCCQLAVNEDWIICFAFM